MKDLGPSPERNISPEFLRPGHLIARLAALDILAGRQDLAKKAIDRAPSQAEQKGRF